MKIIKNNDEEFYQLNSDDENKVKEILKSCDIDGNDEIDPWELHDWILHVEQISYEIKIERLWEKFHVNHHFNNSDNLILEWSDYQVRQNPTGIQSTETERRRKRDLRHWEAADVNHDRRLNRKEFPGFIYPQLNENKEIGISVLIKDEHENLDVDGNERVSLAEFLNIHPFQTRKR